MSTKKSDNFLYSSMSSTKEVESSSLARRTIAASDAFSLSVFSIRDSIVSDLTSMSLFISEILMFRAFISSFAFPIFASKIAMSRSRVVDSLCLS